MAGRHLQNVTDNSVINVSAQRVNLKRVILHNDDASARFMQFFNAASADVTLGTTAPDFVIQIGADKTEPYPFDDMEFTIALSYAITTTATGNTGGTSSWVAISYL